MSNKFPLWLSTATLLLLVGAAHADVFCSASSAGFSRTYNSATLNIVAATFTITCTRDNGPGTANSTVTYQIAANNGLNPLGVQNQAASGANLLNYDLATDSGCLTPWDLTSPLPVPTASFVMTKNSTTSHTYTFYGCIPAAQVKPLGTYFDTVTMSLFTGTGKSTGDQFVFTPGTFPVSIAMPTTCAVTTLPLPVNFTYTAFSASSVLANSSFGVTCSTGLPYSMALDATVGVVAGLNYTLALNTTTSGGTNPLSSSGTGIAQTFYLNGAMAAGQAGSCATAICTASQIRTLTITY